MKTEAIIFDFFGVLCTELRSAFVNEYAREASTATIVHTILTDSDLGYVSLENVYTELGRVVSKSDEEVRDFFTTHAHIDVALSALALKLKSTYQIAICSNAPRGLVQGILKQNNTEHMFDAVCISSELHARKPSPEMFLSCVHALGVSPQSSIYIDDSPENVAAATQLGMNSIVFTTTEALRIALHDRGISEV